MITSESREKLVFDYRTLRLFVGIIAMAFPLVVIWRAQKITLSISSSYHTDAHDWFVGLLFVIGVLMMAYKGHNHTPANDDGSPVWNWIIMRQEDIVTTIGGAMAIVTALYPTYCDGCLPDRNSRIHGIGAFILFASMVYLCWVAFISRAREKINMEEVRKQELHGQEGEDTLAEFYKLVSMQVNQKRRIRLYFSYGLAIALVLIGSIIVPRIWSSINSNTWPITFLAETIALELFGIAWLTASHVLPFFSHREERYYPFGKRAAKDESHIKAPRST